VFTSKDLLQKSFSSIHRTGKMPIPPEKMSVLWDGHLARLSYFCKRSKNLTKNTKTQRHQASSLFNSKKAKKIGISQLEISQF